jgi:hypothetical protein
VVCKAVLENEGPPIKGFSEKRGVGVDEQRRWPDGYFEVRAGGHDKHIS